MVDLPAGEVRAADVPFFALAVRGQDERALARADQNPYLAHLFLLVFLPADISGDASIEHRVQR